MPCPVCIQKGRKSSVAYWKHYEDGGDIYIGSDGFLLCAKCGRRSHIRYWKYKCPKHNIFTFRNCVSISTGDNVTREEFVRALGLSIPMLKSLSLTWIRMLIYKI